MAGVEEDAETVEGLEQFDDVSEDRVRGIVYPITLVFGTLGILVAMNQTFTWDLFGLVLIDNSYYYLLIALFFSPAFLLYPARKKDGARVRYYDWILFVAAVVTAGYMTFHGGEMVEKGWDLVAPTEPTIFAMILCFLALELSLQPSPSLI